MPAALRVASLFLYPVKGARPVALASAHVQVTGLATLGVGDREWMVVDEMGRFVTQREHPRLALVDTALGEGALMLAADGAGETRIPLASAHAAAREVTVWRSHVRGFDEGDEVAAWLCAYLGAAVRLVRFDRSRPRNCNPDFVGRSGAHTLFADGYPVLVIGQASLDDLNARLAAKGHQALPMNRFRPSIVVEGLEAYDEDHVDVLRVGRVGLRMVKPCVRCQVTTTDQATAAVGIEPLPTLAGYRRNDRLAGVCFGMNAIVVDGVGETIAAGSAAEASYRF